MSFLKNAFKGENSIVYYLLGMTIIIVGYFLGSFPLTLAAFYQVNEYKLEPEAVNRFEETLDFSIIHMSNNLGLVLMIMIFVFTLLAFLLVLKIHKKSLKDTITGRLRVDYSRILFGFGFWIILGIIFEFVSWLIFPENYSLTFSLSSFIPLFFICILLLPIQTTTEELVFRGYLLQGLSLIIQQRWIIILITAVLFSMVHSMNPEIEKFGFWTMQLYYVGAGVFLALITLWDDGMELALGVHAATNIFGAMIVSYSGGVLQTDAIWKTSVLTPWFMIIIFYLCTIIFIVVCRKKYNWKPISQLLK